MADNGKNNSAEYLGALNEWSRFSFTHAAIPEPVPGKKFVNAALELTGTEVSFNTVPPQTGIPFTTSII